jgi:hypothetical protein
LKSEEARKAALRVIANLPVVPSHPLAIVISEWIPKRSTDQNRRYWAILSLIAFTVADENGRKYSAETWHEYFKAKYLGKNTMIVDGEPMLIAKSTTRLNKVSFGDYMMRVEVWAVEHGVMIGW